jgi:hypothetical protein
MMTVRIAYIITSTGTSGSIALTGDPLPGRHERSFDGLKGLSDDPVMYAAIDKYLADGTKTGTVTLSAA